MRCSSGLLVLTISNLANRPSAFHPQTNDKGRLSQEDIDRMVKEAAEFADQDEALKKKIDSRNAFESEFL